MTFRSRLPNLKLLRSLHVLPGKMQQQVETENGGVHTIKEGAATIKTAGKVFYNPVQEFNRDLRLEFKKLPPADLTHFLLVFRC